MRTRSRFTAAAIAAALLLAAAPADYRLSKGAYKQITLGSRKAVEIKAGMPASSYDTYRLDVPAGLAMLEVSVIANGEDLDLALKAGSEIASYLEKGDCDYRDFSSDPNPACVLDNPPPGPIFIDVVNLGSAGAKYTLRAESKKAKAPRRGGLNT